MNLSPLEGPRSGSVWAFGSRPSSTDKGPLRINFALVTAAAEPGRRFPEGSLAARVTELYDKHRSSICRGSAGRAQALLRSPSDQRRRFFGPSRTTVEAVRGLGGDIPQWLGREVSMVGTPDDIGFRWVTSEPDAEQLRWELFELGSSEPIASGTEGPAPHGTFVIDFKDHLPPQAGKAPLRYVLRCQPWINGKIHHIGGASPGGGSVVKEPARPAGAPAPLIRIVYLKDESSAHFNLRRGLPQPRSPHRLDRHGPGPGRQR